MTPDDFTDHDGPTIAANRSRAYPDVMLGLDDHYALSRRAFWRGLRLGLALGAVGVLFGVAADTAWSLDISGSVVTVQPSVDPDAFADVVFENNLSNGPMDTGSYTLSQDGLVIGVAFTWDRNFIGMDQIVVTPPVGMTCVPVDCAATVTEGQTGRVTLMPFVGM